MSADRMERVAATRRAETIRDGLMGLASAMTTIAEAYERKDWKVLGYKTWGAYCQGEFGQNRLKLSPDQREQIAIAFRGAGMSKRQIADALGIDESTVRKDLKSAGNPALSGPKPQAKAESIPPQLATVLAANGPTDDVRTETGRANVEAILNAIEWALANGGTEELYAGHLGAIEALLRTTGFTAEQIDAQIGNYRRFDASVPIVAGMRVAIEETAAHTSGAVTPANTEDASPVLGEPGDSDQAAESSGTHTATGTDALQGHPVDGGTVAAPVPAGGTPPAPDGGVEEALPSGVIPEERDEEEAVEPPADLPAADDMAPPSPQQPGQDSPVGREGDRPGTDSPTGLEAVQPHVDRSETSHQQVAGVSPAGEAPASQERAVEPDGEPWDEDTSTSSHGDLPPADQLMAAFATLVHHIAQLDADALGPLLHGEEMELLHQHVDDITDFVGRLGRARFAEMLHP